MTTIQRRMRRRAISNLVVTLIMVGVGAGITFAALGSIQDNLGSMTSTNRVVITSVTAYTSGDRMVISGNLQNLGSQPIESVTIDEITAGDLIITQSGFIDDGQIVAPHGDMTLTGLQHDGVTVNFGTDDRSSASVLTSSGVSWPAGDTTADFYFNPTSGVGGAKVAVTGLSTNATNVVELSAGSTKSFRITITGLSSGTTDAALDILRTVPASTDLFITISGTDGQTSTTSDPRTVRVTAR